MTLLQLNWVEVNWLYIAPPSPHQITSNFFMWLLSDPDLFLNCILFISTSILQNPFQSCHLTNKKRIYILNSLPSYMHLRSCCCTYWEHLIRMPTSRYGNIFNNKNWGNFHSGGKVANQTKTSNLKKKSWPTIPPPGGILLMGQKIRQPHCLRWPPTPRMVLKRFCKVCAVNQKSTIESLIVVGEGLNLAVKTRSWSWKDLCGLHPLMQLYFREHHFRVVCTL